MEARLETRNHPVFATALESRGHRVSGPNDVERERLRSADHRVFVRDVQDGELETQLRANLGNVAFPQHLTDDHRAAVACIERDEASRAGARSGLGATVLGNTP